MMRNSKPQYSVTLEVLHATMIGIAIFIIGSVLVGLASFVFHIVTVGSVDDYQNHQSPAQKIYLVIGMAFLILLWMGIAFVIMLMASLLQFGIIAVPIAKLMTAGLQRDADRSLMFYLVSGTLIGGGPWWLLAFIMFDRTVDLGSAMLILLPGTVVGLLAGLVLKMRLLKLSSIASIENSIK